MSDKITKQEVITRTVTYKIEPSGDCRKCESLVKILNFCMAFSRILGRGIDWQYRTTQEQCQACREFLSERKNRVYCDGCNHFSYGFDDSKCEKEKEIKFDNSFNPEDWYCKNCQDRSE